jgi:hypothetical protein
MTDPDHDPAPEALLVPDHSRAPKSEAYRHRRLELGLIVAVLLVSLFSAYFYLTQSSNNAERAKINRALIERQDREAAANNALRDCQARFNRTFVENLRLRTYATQRGAELTDELILAVGRGFKARTPEQAAVARDYTADLFATYARRSKALKAEQAASPLLPYPDCEALVAATDPVVAPMAPAAP